MLAGSMNEFMCLWNRAFIEEEINYSGLTITGSEIEFDIDITIGRSQLCFICKCSQETSEVNFREHVLSNISVAVYGFLSKFEIT